ncbi:MAG TPA: hypothetical protein VMB26_02485 [Candidatus Binataceae bacterium]|nr:hypothetical protein [Candidatus Binataceae bacterium]
MIGVALLAASMRLAPLARSDLAHAFRPDDSFEYLQLADGIRHGCGFARLIQGTCRPAEILRTPGYPLFLAGVDGSIRWAIAAQAILGGIVCLMVAAWIAGYWNFSAAIAAELLIAFDLPSIVMSNEIMSEALFQFVLVIALFPVLLAAARGRKAVFTAAIAGFVAGIAILVRPIGIILPLLLPIPFLVSRALERRQRYLAAALACAIPVLMVGGWSARNYRVAGYPGLSTVGAINIYYYRAADIVARENNTLLEATRASFGARLGVPYELVYEARVQSAALARRMNQLGFMVIRAHPIEAAVMMLQGSIYLALSPMRSPLAATIGTSGVYHGDGLNAGAFSISRISNTFRLIWQSPVLSVLILFEALLTMLVWAGIGVGLVRCARGQSEYRVSVTFLTATGILLLVLAAGGEADVRFRVPVVPLLAAVAALGYFPQRRGVDQVAGVPVCETIGGSKAVIGGGSPANRSI